MPITMLSCFVVLLILCVFPNLQAIAFPPDMPRCYKNDPNLNECFLKATETIRPKLKSGIIEFGIPPIHPYVVPFVSLEQGSKAMNFKLTVTNLTIEGLDTYKFSKFDFNPTTLKFDILNEFGPLITSSNCHFQGHILLTTLNGTGRLLVDLDNSVFQTIIFGKLVNREGADYYEAANISVTAPNSISGKVQFESFLGVNENIVKAMNKVFQENSDDLMKEILPVFIKFIEDFVGNIYRGIFEKFSYETLLPLSP